MTHPDCNSKFIKKWWDQLEVPQIWSFKHYTLPCSMSVTISSLSFEHHHHPAIGIGETNPRISWKFEGNAFGWTQSSYDIEITRGPDGVPNVYNVNSTDSVLVPWPGVPLKSSERASVRTRANGGQGQPSTDWSRAFTVETGLLTSNDWKGADTIAADRESEVKAPKRPILFRKSFENALNVTCARLYITSLGLYETVINGKRVGSHVLAPGYQSYNHRHVYDTYDVTGYLHSGPNVIGVTVGEGWYAGRFGLQKKRNLHGETLGLLALLVIEMVNGSKQVIKSDTTWRASTGPIVTSELYNGEVYNAGLENEGWSLPHFNDSAWLKTKQLPAPKGKLSSPDGAPIKRIRYLKPREILSSRSGTTIIDFGQNLVGWVNLTVSGPLGTNITLVHAEVLENGELATAPLRSAKATDTVILSGKRDFNWEPKFTYHGFRYVQVIGWPNSTTLDETSINAVVVHSDMERTGHFISSHQLLNRFHDNVVWSMNGNFLSIPTDCPQRDERLGWTGDAHAFMPTSNYLYDASGFWRGWLKDVWSEQAVNDFFVPPFYVPSDDVADTERYRIRVPTAVWGDVVVGNPWALYQTTGDSIMLQEQYAGAQAWIDKGIPRNEVGLWNRSTFQFGDWLDPKAPADEPGDASTHAHLVADAYLIQMTFLLSLMSEALGRTHEAEKYAFQRKDLVSAFQNVWINPYNSIIANVTQTALALGIGFGIFDSNASREKAADTLRRIVADNSYLVGTGFAGTQVLGFTLSSINATSDFYKMLLQTQVPSWLYQVEMGGTTTWERWDSLLPNGSVNAGSMTSFNHYAFGSVADWMHQKIGGLAPAEPGWRKVKVAPEPGGGIAHARASYLGPYGWNNVSWEIVGGSLRLDVVVPPNARAEVWLPGQVENATEVGSGTHRFTLEGFSAAE